MGDLSNLWGVELVGADADKSIWKDRLKSPFDPYVEEVGDVGGDYLVLRSVQFDGVTSGSDVHKLAKKLFSILNVSLSKTADADAIESGDIVEFVPNGVPE